MKNKIQFQNGYSLSDLFHDYGTESQCEQALFNWKWSSGYICPQCSNKSHCRLKCRKIYQCNNCHHQTSLISGTIFSNTNLPLTKWFLATYLIVYAKSGISALALKREIGVSYNTAWSMKHKIQQVMKEREDDKHLSGIIQLDDAYYGGQRHGTGRGRGTSEKTPFVAAVSTHDDAVIAMSLAVVRGFRSSEISKWAKKKLTPGSMVISDGLSCFPAVQEAGCRHTVIVTGSGYRSMQKTEFTWINTMLGNIKSAITGTYHSVSRKHLPRYFAEFCYRFNRRFDLKEMIPRFMYIALRTPPMPYRLLKMAEDCG